MQKHKIHGRDFRLIVNPVPANGVPKHVLLCHETSHKNTHCKSNPSVARVELRAGFVRQSGVRGRDGSYFYGVADLLQAD